MPATEAQIRANQANAARSKGPTTTEGKARSRANALKHGLTGDGIVLPAEDAAEVDRLYRSLEAELKPSREVGRTLVRRIRALMAVRMDRSADQERAHLAEHIGEVLADFDEEWPAVEGVADPERERMRTLVALPQGDVQTPLSEGDPGPQVRGRRRTRLLPAPQGAASIREAKPRLRGTCPRAEPWIGFVFASGVEASDGLSPAVEPARKVCPDPLEGGRTGPDSSDSKPPSRPPAGPGNTRWRVISDRAVRDRPASLSWVDRL